MKNGYNFENIIANDKCNNVMTFFHVLKSYPRELQHIIQKLEYNRDNFYKCKKIIRENKYPERLLLKDHLLLKAVSFFVYCNWSFLSSGDTFMDKTKKRDNKKSSKNKAIYLLKASEFLKNTEIKNLDVRDVIHWYDDKDTFFYLDPPYPNTNQKWKNKYKPKDFQNLISMLENIKGRFILSYYEEMDFYHPTHWKVERKYKTLDMGAKYKDIDRKRYECIIRNY